MLVILFLSLFALSTSKCENVDGPIVETQLGKVKGFRQVSHGGREFSAFEGIPYGKPPIGARRFEEPEPVGPWVGTWDARFPTICPQSSLPGLEITDVQSEDCLHLNIYVPRDNPNPETELDVIVHIHGGGYIVGHGNLYCRPTFIMDHDVIFVTFNYRVGILGFLSTEDDVASGNMGLKDQVLALRWVQDNIKSFGGNPNSVTLSGVSAGGGSTHLHYFSELSKGLFHRGLTHSALALNPWTIQENPLDNAKKLAEAVGCPTAANKDMVNCLKQRPDRQLIDKVPLFYVYSVLPAVPFGPVVEKGPRPFLKDHPYNLLKKNQVLDVPFIASNTAHEGSFAVAFLMNDLKTVNDKWLDLAPYLLDFNQTLAPSKWQSTSQKIKDYYFGKDQEINQENFLKLVELSGDRFFYADAEDALLLQAASTKSPVYYYWFSYLGDDNEMKIVGHGADAVYFFGHVLPSPKDLTENELKMKDLMVDMLISYARTGKASVRGSIWPSMDADGLSYIDISGFKSKDIKVHRTNNLRQKQKKFWKSLGFLENENLARVKDEL